MGAQGVAGLLCCLVDMLVSPEVPHIPPPSSHIEGFSVLPVQIELSGF